MSPVVDEVLRTVGKRSLISAPNRPRSASNFKEAPTVAELAAGIGGRRIKTSPNIAVGNRRQQ